MMDSEDRRGVTVIVEQKSSCFEQGCGCLLVIAAIVALLMLLAFSGGC